MKKFWIIVLMGLLLSATTFVYAAYDIKTMTPAIKEALESRQKRFDELKELKARGVIGENNRGYVEMLKGQSAKDVVNAENADRRVIYEAIVSQNNLDEGALATVEAVFAGVQRDKADKGEKIQEAGGKWATK